MGGDAQPQIAAQVVSGLVDLGRDVRHAVSAARWFVEPAAHFDPPVEVRAEPRFAPGVLDDLRRLGHPVDEMAAFDAVLGHCHAIELVGGGPAVPDGSLGAATDPRSAGLPAVR
jgi:gamma-glutamyltranspeptidase/glutathione hydrolase